MTKVFQLPSLYNQPSWSSYELQAEEYAWSTHTKPSYHMLKIKWSLVANAPIITSPEMQMKGNWINLKTIPLPFGGEINLNDRTTLDLVIGQTQMASSPTLDDFILPISWWSENHAQG